VHSEKLPQLERTIVAASFSAAASGVHAVASATLKTFMHVSNASACDRAARVVNGDVGLQPRRVVAEIADLLVLIEVRVFEQAHAFVSSNWLVSLPEFSISENYCQY
jgi:hypothetical protein